MFFSCYLISYICLVLLLKCFIGIKICGTERDDCDELATCTDIGHGSYECTCNEGYTGDGKTCSGLIKENNNYTSTEVNVSVF